MRERGRVRLFERWRRRGDAAALGRLFDETAPELVRVAMGLVAEPGDADDLVQQTFLTAIERAERFDAERRVTAWLVGILVHHAHEARRGRRRAREAEPREGAEVPDPARDAAAAELGAELERALAALSTQHRDVVEPYLREGRRPVELARERGLAPGTVRMRIHRGLDELRRALPRGLALGALVAASGIRPGSGLAAVRAEVLRRAAPHAATLAGAAAASHAPLLLGGLTVTKKVAALALALVLAAGALAVSRLAAAPPVADGPTVAATPATRADGADRSPLRAPQASEQPAVEERRALAPPPVAFAADPPPGWRRALAGVRGRLVEHGGAPAAGVEVALVEAPDSVVEPRIDAPLDESAGATRWFADRAVTDASGAFELVGARPDGRCALGIDLGGARPSLRALDVELRSGEVADLGTLRLGRTRVVAGVVVDDAGAPLAGVRVRLLPLATTSRWRALAGIRGDTPVRVHQGPLALVFDAPKWFADAEPLLPLATLATDAAGRFAFELAPEGAATLLADAPGRVAVDLELEPVGAVDDARLVLPRGRAASGIVVDTSGAPIAGADVRGGVRPANARDLCVFDARATSDGAGRFEVAGLLEEGELAVAARSHGGARWTVRSFDAGEAIVLELPDELPFAVRVVDADGAPVEAAEVVLTSSTPLPEMGFEWLLRRTDVAARAQAVGAGRYEARVARGSYRVLARAAGFADATLDVRVRQDDDEHELVMRAPRELVVRVVDAADEPVADARVALVLEERPTALARAWTAADGSARLAVGAIPEGARVAVEHPRFAPASAPVADDDAAVEVALARGAIVTFELRREGGAPRAAYHVELESDGALRRVRADANGDARFTRLVPGDWTYTIGRDVTGGELIHSVQSMFRAFLQAGHLTVAAGQELVVPIEVDPFSDVTPGTARVLATVTLDGEPLRDGWARMTLETDGAVEQRIGSLDLGQVHFENLPAARATVAVYDASGVPAVGMSKLGDETIELADGETRELELAFHSLPLVVRVRTAQGAPADAAIVQVRGTDASTIDVSRYAWADADGVARPSTTLRGEYRVLALHERGWAQADVTLGAEGAEVELQLVAGASLAGTIACDDAGKLPRFLRLVRHEPSLVEHVVPIDLRGGPAELAPVSLPPGAYVADLIALFGGYEPLELQVEPGMEPVALLFRARD